MTAPVLAAVVRCGERPNDVYTTIASLVGGSRGPDRIAVVADQSRSFQFAAWLEAFCRVRGMWLVHVDRATPGAAWNAGLERVGPADLAVCIEAGDRLAGQALEAFERALSEDPDLEWVTSAVEWIDRAQRRTFTSPAGCTPSDLLADFDAAHVSSLFRYGRWKAAGGFDEDFAALEYTDLWLRLMGDGRAGAALAAPLLLRVSQPHVLHRRTWGTAAYRQAVRRLIEKHAALAEPMAGPLLEKRDRDQQREVARYKILRTRETQARSRIQDLESRWLEATRDLQPEADLSVESAIVRRTTPFSYNWGDERGTPADRPLIERFLADNAAAVSGAVLEVQENDYTIRIGGGRVTKSDVFDANPGNPKATVLGDLRAAYHLPDASYDCVILTQTLHLIDDVEAVLRECYRLLKPNGVLLATWPAASRVCLEYGPEADLWRVTPAGARKLFSQAFTPEHVDVFALGNASLSAAFSLGLPSQSLPEATYESSDPFFPVIVAARARRPSQETAPLGRRRRTSLGLDGGRGLILMYHRIGSRRPDPHRLSLSEAAFDEQLVWLRNTCSVIPLDELVTGTQTGSLPPRSIAMTFDDGYIDNLTSVAPRLQRAGAPATFFLTSDDSDSPCFYWWDRLAVALLGDGPRPSSLDIDLPDGPQTLDTSNPSGRLAAHSVLYHATLRLEPSARNAIVQRVADWSGATQDACDRRMSREEVCALSLTPGVTIGAHTVHHLRLPDQTDDVVASELQSSRSALQEVTNRPVEAFSYPFGAVDDRAAKAAEAAGFTCAVTGAFGATTSFDDRFYLPRIPVAEGPLEQFIARIDGALAGPL